MRDDDILVLTKAWLEKVVIGLGLCPFAFEVFSKGKIKYDIVAFRDAEEFIHTFLLLCKHILSEDATETTALLVIPEGLDDFHDYLSVYESLEAILEKEGWDEVIQLASFHPRYQFAGTNENDVENYTNRSPYPIVHLLRVDDVTQAVAEHPDAEKIPLDNIASMKGLGRDAILLLWSQFNPLSVK